MSFGFKEILVIAVIVVLIFGTKKLRGMGSDLGASVKGFKDAMKEGETNPETEITQKNEHQPKSDDQQQS